MGGGIILGELQHLIDCFRGNCKQNFTTVSYNGSLAWKITSLAFKDKLWEMIGLRKHIKG